MAQDLGEGGNGRGVTVRFQPGEPDPAFDIQPVHFDLEDILARPGLPDGKFGNEGRSRPGGNRLPDRAVAAEAGYDVQPFRGKADAA